MTRAVLSESKIYGISSMLRELSLLSAQPRHLENAILGRSYPLEPGLLRELPIVMTRGRALNVGDVVLFSLRGEIGAYPDMETLWGDRVDLAPGRVYVGVLCERQSSKLITGEFLARPQLGPQLDLQLIAQGGGIGYATGFSPTLRREHGSGRPADVEILGALGHPSRPGELLNTVRDTSPVGMEAIRRRVPQIVCVGTATDVGKTTLIGAVIAGLSRFSVCAALKASGTGWYEDTLLHMQHGARLGSNFTFAGLPTTYNLPADLYLSRIRTVIDALTSGSDMPQHLLPPRSRCQTCRAQLLLVEHGGDLIEANIPAYLGAEDLMRDVLAILICSESALALRGALDELKSLSVARSPLVYANMPLVNPQGFMRRVEPLLRQGLISGVVDVNKPSLPSARARRLAYAERYDDILDVDSFAGLLHRRMSPARAEAVAERP